MDSVFRALAIYLVLVVIFRISGKRALSEVTTFDFILLLIISEATQQALLGEDFSITAGVLIIVTLISVDIGLSLVTSRLPFMDKVLSDVPTIVVQDGRPLDRQMHKLRVSVDDVLEHARASHGIDRLEEIKYAVVERNGGISVVPASR